MIGRTFACTVAIIILGVIYVIYGGWIALASAAFLTTAAIRFDRQSRKG